MGSIAATEADRIVLTSDNPRTERPEMILRAIRAGVLAKGRDADLLTTDREEAILAAIDMAAERDTVLIAGKGHEDYQEIGTIRRPFDDRERARRALEALGFRP
jgi:UDP-N-acetylmuramoyl-L-alanyl-D-glutamate--2,6-diaminopimelate ligase